MAMRQPATSPACSRVFFLLLFSFYSHSTPIPYYTHFIFMFFASFHLIYFGNSFSSVDALRTVKSSPLLTYLFPVFSRSTRSPPFLARLHKISLIPATRPSHDIRS